MARRNTERGNTDQSSGKVAAAPDQRERDADPRLPSRFSGFRALGDSTTRIAGPIAAKHGGGVLARLKAEWTAILGPELAGFAWPEALGRDGALKLRCAPGFALDLQHCTPMVVQRINLFFGRAAVTRIAIVQGPLPLAAPRLPAAPLPSLSTAARQEVQRQVAAVDHAELREALDRFGQSLLATGARRE
ncbi:MAG: DUF721 domain-containing protein [Alphaproteobacteria bacterium]|nr:DUF721 domain-containing protein [Alphaproteobacteria bacterium]